VVHSAAVKRKQLQQCATIARANFYKHPSQTYRLWAFVWQGGELVDWSTNKKATARLRRCGYGVPGNNCHRDTLHAEPEAFRKSYGLLDHRKAWSIVCIRIRKDMSFGMACPCALCNSFIKAHGCSEAYFTVYGNDFAKIV
jgi:hypothetical protein